MALLLDINLYNAAAIFIALCVGLITFFKWRYNHWTRLGIPTVAPIMPFGNLKDFVLQTKPVGVVFEDIYNEGKSKGYAHVGAFYVAQPVYVPIDPEIAKQILVKDFAHFMNRNFLNVAGTNDPLAGHLFSLEHQKWKGLRQKFSPTFTSGQLKSMFQTIAYSAKNLQQFFKRCDGDSPLDIKDIAGRYTTDTIGSCAFGIECNSLKDPNAEFRKYGKQVFDKTLSNSLRWFALIALPVQITSALGIKFVTSDVERFFMSATNDMVSYRDANNVQRKDFMDLLIKIKNHGEIGEDGEVKQINGKSKSVTLTMDELAAQAFVFYLAGFETSSTAMTFALFEISRNQKIQDRLRKEINSVLEKHNGEMSYDALMEMHYLQQVIDESLRMYPPVPFLNRQCTKDYTLPNSDIVLKKNTKVMISVLGIHRDPQHYPNPLVFNPERFSSENKQTRPSGTYLPFGDGPRNCIGLRFGLIQSKIGLITVLKDHKVTLNPKTSLPLTIDPGSLVLAAKDDIWLDIKKLSV